VKKTVLIMELILFSAVACKALAPDQLTKDETVGTLARPTGTSTTIVKNPPTLTALPADTALPTQITYPTMTSLPIVAAVPTDTPLPTAAPLPTATLTPTSTLTPTHTPSPTPTPTIPQVPLVFSGSGAKVLELNKWVGPAIARITHSGKSYFQIEGFDAYDKHIEFLVDSFGDYSGIVPVDFGDKTTRRLTVNADGAWGIQILPLSSAQIMPLPGILAGKGDLVFMLVGAAPDTISVDASQASGSFIIQAYNQKPALEYLDLLVNEIAPFTGVFMAPNRTTLLAISASGAWKLDITGK